MARLWITAYANDDPCYIPSERILREGGYEGGGAIVYYGHVGRRSLTCCAWSPVPIR